MLTIPPPSYRYNGLVKITTPIGGVSATGAIRIGPDCFVSDWVWKGAPFTARESNTALSLWKVNNKNGRLVEYSLPQAKAQAYAEELNTLAAAAQLLRV